MHQLETQLISPAGKLECALVASAWLSCHSTMHGGWSLMTFRALAVAEASDSVLSSSTNCLTSLGDENHAPRMSLDGLRQREVVPVTYPNDEWYEMCIVGFLPPGHFCVVTLHWDVYDEHAEDYQSLLTMGSARRPSIQYPRRTGGAFRWLRNWPLDGLESF